MSSLIFGGFRITRFTRGYSKLLPARIASASPCLMERVPSGLLSPDTGLRDQAGESLVDAAESLGLTDTEVLRIIEQGEANARDVPQLHWPTAASTLAAAKAILEILPSRLEWLVLGVAINAPVAQEMMAALGEPPVLRGSVADHLRAGSTQPDGGTFLGFELLTYESEYDFGCSGFCCQVEEKVLEQMGLRPNRYGLIEHAQDARIAAQRTTIERWGEPIQHWPVALFDFTESTRRSDEAGVAPGNQR